MKTIELSDREFQVLQTVLLQAEDELRLRDADAIVLETQLMPKFNVQVYADPRACRRCGG